MELSVTLVIVAITVLVSLAAFNNQDLTNQLIFSPYQAKHQNEWWRAITHGFIHADHMHLFFNMYVLYNFGDLIEQTLIYIYGSTTGMLYFVGMYVGGLLFATLPSMRKHSDNPMYRSLGASGAVSTVLFAFIIYYPSEKLSLLFIPIGIPAYIFGALYLAFETYSNKNGRTNIAHDAHIAGALFGVLYVIVLDFDNLARFVSQIGIG
ncbi:MAG: rhomboid family intramembrane serine protease [Flavobacteriales bacterium]|jgi:membrane associated rhomboid family serine protease|nr:rhomboid family intramembrane serine protease [Flavobacteriales bacterium]